MVSARITHLVVRSELCKMNSSPAITRSSPCAPQLARIKRNLFGAEPTPLAENSFLSAELELQQERASQKWGFDFRVGSPFRNSIFTWERVSTQESTCAPQMYTLTRAAHVRPATSGSASDMDSLLDERADRENLANSSLDSNTDTDYDSQDESLNFNSSSIKVVASTSAAALIASSSSSSGTIGTSSPAQHRKRQLKITEFMKERKRLVQPPKKLAPAKRLRSNSGSSSSATFVSEALLECLPKRTRHN